jgi:hypothetical protein
MRFPPTHVWIFAAALFSGCAAAHPNYRAEHGQNPILEAKISRHEPITEREIGKLSRQGWPPREIIGYIRRSHSVYVLREDTESRLIADGVDPEVVDYILSVATIPTVLDGPHEVRGDDPFIVPYAGASLTGVGADSNPPYKPIYESRTETDMVGWGMAMRRRGGADSGKQAGGQACVGS